MAGDIGSKERAIVTLTTAGASLSNNSAGAANATADLDARAGGNLARDLAVLFELTMRWATVTGIVAGTVVADLYLVPLLDGTNLPDLDLTAGASRLPAACLAGSFEATKAPTADTDMRFVSPVVALQPLLYRPYIQQRAGQTCTANWTLKAVGAQGQYT